MEASPPPHFNSVAIIGVGLLGASLGLALKARGLAGEVVGVGRREASLQKALSRGAVDRYSLDLAAASATADLVVIATPADAVIPALDVVRQVCKSAAVVTDVASTKSAICAHAQTTWTAPRRFVGSHPMAGSEQFGPEHGRANFYEGSVCLMEPPGGIDAPAHESVKQLWQAVGAQVIEVAPDQHDAILARTSHLPHIAAAACALSAARMGDVRLFLGNGFRDTTRIAEGRPEVWRDICLTNRDAVADSLRELRFWLVRFQEALEDADGERLEQLFQDARDARRRIVSE